MRQKHALLFVCLVHVVGNIALLVPTVVRSKDSPVALAYTYHCACIAFALLGIVGLWLGRLRMVIVRSYIIITVLVFPFIQFVLHGCAVVSPVAYSFALPFAFCLPLVGGSFVWAFVALGVHILSLVANFVVNSHQPAQCFGVVHNGDQRFAFEFSTMLAGHILTILVFAKLCQEIRSLKDVISSDEAYMERLCQLVTSFDGKVLHDTANQFPVLATKFEWYLFETIRKLSEFSKFLPETMWEDHTNPVETEIERHPERGPSTEPHEWRANEIPSLQVQDVHSVSPTPVRRLSRPDPIMIDPAIGSDVGEPVLIKVARDTQPDCAIRESSDPRPRSPAMEAPTFLVSTVSPHVNSSLSVRPGIPSEDSVNSHASGGTVRFVGSESVRSADSRLKNHTKSFRSSFEPDDDERQRAREPLFSPRSLHPGEAPTPSGVSRYQKNNIVLPPPSPGVRKTTTLGLQRKSVSLLVLNMAKVHALEEATPSAIFQRYLEEFAALVCPVVRLHKGTIVSCSGGRLVASWNASSNNGGHATLACKCALELQTAVEGFSSRIKTWNASEFIEGGFRIAVATSMFAVGNIGNPPSFNIVGRAFKLLMKLEELNDHLGTRMLISQGTYSDAKLHIVARPVDIVQSDLYHGIVYELLDEFIIDDDEWMYTLEKRADSDPLKPYIEGFRCFAQHDYEKAKGYFERYRSSGHEPYIRKLPKSAKASPASAPRHDLPLERLLTLANALIVPPAKIYARMLNVTQWVGNVFDANIVELAPASGSVANSSADNWGAI